MSRSPSPCLSRKRSRSPSPPPAAFQKEEREALVAEHGKCGGCDEPNEGFLHDCGWTGCLKASCPGADCKECPEAVCPLNGKELCQECHESTDCVTMRKCSLCKQMEDTYNMEPANPRALTDEELVSLYEDEGRLPPDVATLEQKRQWAEVNGKVAFRVKRGCEECVTRCGDCDFFWTPDHMNGDQSLCLGCEAERLRDDLPPPKRAKTE